MNTCHNSTTVSAVFALILSASSLPAVSVNFRSTPGQTNLTSVGIEEKMDAGFIFGVGAFEGTFAPNSGNLSEWAANWRPLGYTSYNSKTKFFAATPTLSSNAAPFSTNRRGYIWGFRSSGGRNEWILVSDPSWMWPFAGSGLGFPVTWDLSLAADVIVGETNGSGFDMKSAYVSGSLPSPDLSPAEWNAIYPTAGAWEDDPDKDGLSNLTEFALGLSPVSASSGPANAPKLAIVEDSSGEFLSLRVFRRNSSFVSLSVEFSSDLMNWNATGATVTDTPIEFHVRDNLLFTTQQRRFVRLRVDAP